MRFIYRQPHLKAGVAGFGEDPDIALVVLDDHAVGDIQAEPRALANILRGVETLEDPFPYVVWDARAVVGDLDQNPSVLAGSPDLDASVAVYGVYGVVEQVRPHLVQFACVAADVGEVLLIVADDLDVALLQLVSEHDQGAVQPGVYVDLPGGRLVHVRVHLDRPDQLRDARRPFLDLPQQLTTGHRRPQPAENATEGLIRYPFCEPFEPGRVQPGAGEGGGDLPPLLDAVVLHPHGELILQVAHFQRVEPGRGP